MQFSKKTVVVGSYNFKQPTWDITVPVEVIQGKNSLEVVFAKGYPGIILKNISETSIFESIEKTHEIK